MDYFNRFFGFGKSNTVLLRNNGGFTHSGPWRQLGTSTNFDRWYTGEVMAAEYTIIIDESEFNKEIIKCLVIASTERANVQIIGRSFINKSVADVEVNVTKSYVDMFLNPMADRLKNAKFIYTVNYFSTLTPTT